MDEYIRKEDAVDELRKEPIFSDSWNTLAEARDRIKALKHADVLPYTLSPDGILTITVPRGTIYNTVLVQEEGVQVMECPYED